MLPQCAIPKDIFKMHINKVLLTIFLCAIGAWCGNGTLIRNTRTISFGTSSSSTWSQVFSNFWPNLQFWKWPRNSIASLVRFISFPNTIAGSMRIEFGPEDGQRAAKMYQRLFGYRGQWLIEQLGKGFDPDSLTFKQPVPNLYLTPPLPPSRSDNIF